MPHVTAQLNNDNDGCRGFSLIELLLSMTVTLVLFAMATQLLSASYNVRHREDQRSDAIADTQRTLSIVTREIANAGFGLTENGLVAGDSGSSSVRIRANLNAFDAQTTSNATSDENEDVKYLMYIDDAASRRYLVRHDVNAGRTTVLANRIDSFRVYYFGSRVSYTASDCGITVTTPGATEVSPSAATYIVLVACVELPAVGARGATGYQPPAVVGVASDVVLRNSALSNY